LSASHPSRARVERQRTPDNNNNNTSEKFTLKTGRRSPSETEL
jgi:hypothetical protein